jgi:lia operon protein LiaG
MKWPTLTLWFLLSISPSALVSAQQPERYSLDAGAAAIYNLVGNVRVESGSGAVTVQVTRAGGDMAKLRIGQGAMDGRSTLRVIYPADRIRSGNLRSHGSTQLRVRDDGTFGDQDWQAHGRKEHHHWEEEGRRVTITDDSDGLDARADLVVGVPKGANVSLYLAVGSVTVSNVDGELRVDSHSAPITASGTRGTLQVDVGAGDVRIAQAQGEVHVDTGSGTVDVTGFHGSSLSIDTGSGDVTGSDFETDDLSVDTGSGEVRISGVASPSVSLETGSGGITAELRRDVASLSVETGSGDIAIHAPATLGAEVEIETSSGDIETDFPLLVTRQSRDHMKGTVGDGKGTIAIETGSGGIKLLKSN